MTDVTLSGPPAPDAIGFDPAAPLWCVHVRGPDDLVPVASYEDALQLADGLNWWWLTLAHTENDPWLSAVPALWDGKSEVHARELAKLGTKGSDYGLPLKERVEELRVAAFKRLIAIDAPVPNSARADV